MEYSFEDLQFIAGVSVSNQVVQYIKQKIVSGEIKNGTQLPSRRKLAVQLSINPNTVQKIYKQLEEEGLIENTQGTKSLLCVDEKKLSELKKVFIEDEYKKMLLMLKESGMSFQDVVSLSAKLWE